MPTTVVTAAAAEPVSLAEAKTHLRVTWSDEDGYISDFLIPAAREEFETYTKRLAVTQTVDYTPPIADFPDEDFITIPVGNVQSITSLKYTDSDGTENTFASSNYFLQQTSGHGRLHLGYQKDWPTATLKPGYPIVIRVIAGYGDAADVPARAKQGMLTLIGAMYEHREDFHLGQGVVKVEIPYDSKRAWRPMIAHGDTK